MNELLPRVKTFTIYTCPYWPCSYHVGDWNEVHARREYLQHQQTCAKRTEHLKGEENDLCEL